MTNPSELEREREREALDAHRAYVAQRTLCVQGEAPWSSIAAWFTEDAVFNDPAWGRVVGREQIGEFFDRVMTGFEGWSYPDEWTMIEGDRLVSFWWNRLPGDDAQGQPLQAPAFSVLHYAGAGLFDYEMDVLNIVHVTELITTSGWRPGPGATFPTPHPNRDPRPPRLATP